MPTPKFEAAKKEMGLFEMSIKGRKIYFFHRGTTETMHYLYNFI